MGYKGRTGLMREGLGSFWPPLGLDTYVGTTDEEITSDYYFHGNLIPVRFPGGHSVHSRNNE